MLLSWALIFSDGKNKACCAKSYYVNEIISEPEWAISSIYKPTGILIF